VLNLSNRQVIVSSHASANRRTNGGSTPLTVEGYGMPGINGQGQLRPAQAPPALRGSWRGAVSGQPNGRGNANGTSGRGHINGTMPIRNISGSPANANRGNAMNGQYRGGRGMGHVSRAGYTVVDRGDPQAGVMQHNPNFRPKAQNYVPPPANLDQSTTPRGRGRGRGGAPRGGRGTTPRGGS